MDTDDLDKIRDTRMKLLFIGLFCASVVVAFSCVVFVFGFSILGLWAGLGVAGGFGVALTWFYRRLRVAKKARVSLSPGEVPCPKCQSLQTDRVEEERPEGGFDQVSVCFNCDHRW